MRRRVLFLLGLLASVTFSSIAPTTEALFAPDDRPKNKLIELITAAKKKIYAAVYMFTEKGIAAALIDAKQRGVDVRMVVDPTSTANQYGQAFELQKNKIPVFVFDTKQHHATNARVRAFAPLMHNKFAVVDGVVWTGSFNWTQSANSRNQENVIITDDKSICQKYEQQFAVLVQRCRSLAECVPQEKKKIFWGGRLMKALRWSAKKRK
jgi:phosphatidylserine/phosphatidylglycerophosphate/cardiolipin synthase-like enzyme